MCLGGGPLRQCLSLSPQGVTHQQWYLFNDFLIEPVDKVSTRGRAPAVPRGETVAVGTLWRGGFLLHPGAPCPTLG